MPLLDGFAACGRASTSTSTPRAHVHAELRRRGWAGRLEAAGFTLVVDTCTYVTAVMRDVRGAVMTNSGKWAHYAPSNLGVDVAFGTLADCLASAAARPRGAEGVVVLTRPHPARRRRPRPRRRDRALELLGRLRPADRPRHRPLAPGLRPLARAASSWS